MIIKFSKTFAHMVMRYEEVIVRLIKNNNESVNKENINWYRNGLSFRHIYHLIISLFPYTFLMASAYHFIAEGIVLSKYSHMNGVGSVAFSVMAIISLYYAIFVGYKIAHIRSINKAEKNLCKILD